MSKGRGNSNSLTIGEAVRLNIDNLKKTKCIVKGAVTTFTTKWNTGAAINAKIKYTETEKTILLNYSYNQKPIENLIQIVEVKSNLGKGFNLYFICPITGNKCKTLFCSYSSQIFKSRLAYSKRIYYSTQICSKVFRISARYFNTDKAVNRMYKLRSTKEYNGKETKRHKRLIALIDKRAYLDELRNEELDRYLEKLYSNYNYNP